MEWFNPFESGGSGGGGSIQPTTIDSQVNKNSENPVQNKAIYSFVNSSVATNTANFIGTFSSVSELENYTGEVTNNDYAFVRAVDVAGNTIYNRYKYKQSDNSWLFEYSLNNSSFTANQWSTINSGLTSTDKQKLDNIESGANKYTLPKATNSTLGGIKVGDNLSIDNNGVLSAADVNEVSISATTPTDETEIWINPNEAVVETIPELLDTQILTTDTWSSFKINNELTLLKSAISELQAYIGYEEDTILGLQVDYQNKTFTRLAAARELTAGADFNQFSIYGNRRRCNVADDGTINAFYGDLPTLLTVEPSDWSTNWTSYYELINDEYIRVSGDSAPTFETDKYYKSGYIEDGSNGQVMVYQPKFYYKVLPLKLEFISGSEGYHIRKANYYISMIPKEGFKLHPAFYDENKNEIDYYLTGAYEASLYDTSATTYIVDDAQVANFDADKLCSIANVKPMSGLTQNLTRANCEKLGVNRGTGWHNTTLAIESAEQLLMMIEMGKMNMQSVIGNGVVSKDSGSGNQSVNTGSTSNLGNSTGMASGTNGQVSISYRGRENPYGNIWAFVNGVSIWGDGAKRGGIPYIATGFTFTESTKTGYESAGFTISNNDGYISAMGYGNPDYDWIFFASETSGNNSLPVGDYTYKTANLNGWRVARLGGIWGNGLYAGSFCWNLDSAPSNRYRSVGGRAAFIPSRAT